MNLIELIEKLIKFDSYNGNIKSINNCLDFCINYFLSSKNIFIKKIEINNVRSVLFSNTNSLNLDILEVGHIDVVPVNNLNMFNPKIINNIIYGRGTGDMKGFVAVAMKLFEYVINNNLNIKYGLLITTDEEEGGFNGAQYWSETLNLKSKIILDADAGNNLNTIIYKSKACFFVKLISKGQSAHGSKPWLGIDANESMIRTINNLRQIFPYFSKNNLPKDEWTTSMHVGIMKGGEMINSVASYCEAIVDFRYTEKYTNDSLLKTIKNCLEEGVDVIVQEKGIPVFNDINNKYIQLYKSIIEKQTKKDVNFAFTTSASDSRYFAQSDSIIISNQADCGNLHSENEWLDLKKLEEFWNIRLSFITSIIGN